MPRNARQILATGPLPARRGLYARICFRGALCNHGHKGTRVYRRPSLVQLQRPRCDRPSAAAPMARRCPAFDKVESQEIQGHRTVFHDRVYAIQVQGAVCATAKSQILQTSRALATRGKGLGVFIRVGAWSCASFRPFMGGAHFIHWDSECRQPHGHHLSWSERTLSSHRLT